jgi:pimeloyl-ACP methyl ester carboxylesterase
MKENKWTCNGLKLNYMEYANEQSPILLLHGATNRWQSFSSIIPDLTQDFHVYALDFRGHGLSQRATSYTLQDYLSDTYAFIKECIKKPVIIVGHSLGGMIGLLLAAYYPDLVQKLVLIDTPLTLKSLKRLSAGPVEHANWLIHSLRYTQLVPGLPLPEGLRQCDPEMLLSIVNEFEQTFDLYKEHEFFTQIICPVLLIRGSAELGSLINEHDLKATLKLIPHLTHVKIAHAGHSPIMQDKQAVFQAIRSFLALH